LYLQLGNSHIFYKFRFMFLIFLYQEIFDLFFVILEMKFSFFSIFWILRDTLGCAILELWCKLSDWTEWTECSATCGNPFDNERMREKTCIDSCTAPDCDEMCGECFCDVESETMFCPDVPECPTTVPTTVIPATDIPLGKYFIFCLYSRKKFFMYFWQTLFGRLFLPLFILLVFI